MIQSSAMQRTIASDAYTDLSSLNSIRDLAKTDKNAALEEVAKQFESMLIRMMMKSMRDANAVFSEGNMLDSSATTMYQQMYDDQLAVTLGKGRGMGIADLMVKQLQQRFGTNKLDSDVAAGLTMGEAKEKPQATPAANTKMTMLAPVEQSDVNFDGSVGGFVKSVFEMAKSAAEKLNVDVKTLLAQAGLETGWGKKIIKNTEGSSFNLFNIKAGKDWQGESVSISTLEFKNDIPVKEKAEFRSYDSIQQSFDDYVDFVVGRGRYDKALKTDNGDDYIKELASAGYATDPAYADKIINIANSDSMHQALAAIGVKN